MVAVIMMSTSMFHGLLQEIAQALSRKKIDAGYRQQLTDNVLPYIESGNAGLDDDLYDLAYASCYTDDDWRALAEAFETMGGDWQCYQPRPPAESHHSPFEKRNLNAPHQYHDCTNSSPMVSQFL